MLHVDQEWSSVSYFIMFINQNYTLNKNNESLVVVGGMFSKEQSSVMKSLIINN